MFVDTLLTLFYNGIESEATAMASIKANKNSSGKIISYRFRACIGRDDLGKQIFSTKTVKVEGLFSELTPKKLESAMQLAADEWERGILMGAIPSKKQTFQDFVTNTWMPLQVNDGQHRPNTIAFYTEAATPIVKAFGTRSIDSISPVDVQKYLRALAEKTSAATVSRHYRVIKMIFRYAYRVDVIPRNIMEKVTPPKKPAKGKITVLTEAEAKEWITAINEYATPFWKTVSLLLMMSGLRRGEAIGLQWGDIDFKNKTLTVNRNVTNAKNETIIGEPKTPQSQRTIPLSGALSAALSDWRKEQAKMYGTLLPNAFLFNTPTDPYQPITPHAVSRWMWKFTKDHDLPPCHPHELRHTAATVALASGASIKDVQEMLGHADAATTLNFYAAATPETLRKAVDGLADALTKFKNS
jgi:integrase